MHPHRAYVAALRPPSSAQWLQRLRRLLRLEVEPLSSVPVQAAAMAAVNGSMADAHGLGVPLTYGGSSVVDNLDRPQTKTTVLPNGLRVCSENSYGQIATVGLLINAGSRDQTPDTVGVAHLLDRMAFKSSHSRSTEQFMDELVIMGGSISAAASREAITYNGTVFRHHIPQLVDVIADTVLRPNLLADELEEQKINAEYEFQALDDQIDLVMSEMVQMAAYKQNTIGLPLLVAKDALDKTNIQTLKEFRAKYFRPSNAIFAGAGVDHEEMVELAHKYFGGDWKIAGQEAYSTVPSRAKAHYTGGEIAVENPSLPLLHMSIGFEGAPISDANLYAMTTLNILMGGGGSFSVGGPGKGMYSRLYTNVLNRYDKAESAQSACLSFTDTGLFMINFSSEPKFAHHLVDVILAELRDMGRNITREELERSRNQLKSSLLMNLETKAVQFEDISRQVQALNHRIPVDQLCRNIDAVTERDISQFAEHLLRSPMTLAVAGNLRYAPKLRKIAQRL